MTSYEEMLRVPGLAKELGFDSVWLRDHFLTLVPGAYVEDAGITRGGADIDAAPGTLDSAVGARARTWLLRLGTREKLTIIVIGALHQNL